MGDVGKPVGGGGKPSGERSEAAGYGMTVRVDSLSSGVAGASKKRNPAEFNGQNQLARPLLALPAGKKIRTIAWIKR